MEITLNGFVDSLKSLFGEVMLPKGREDYKKTESGLVLEKSSDGVKINGEFIAKENLPDLLTFLATGRIDARKR